MVGVVLAIHLLGHRIFDEGNRNVATGGKNSGQEARSERMTSGGVAERRELQLVRCRCRRVVGEPRLLLVEHEGTLG